MTETWKKSRAGFTLVELIVVIAILAILAGVSVPVYSGYVAKAGKAADMQLLGAMNTAFAAACAGKGLNPTDAGFSAAVATSGQPGELYVTGLTQPGELNDDFLLYYGDNASVPFKTFAYIGYDNSEGVFRGYAAGDAVPTGMSLSIPYTYTDGNGVEHTGSLSVNADTLNAYLGSTFDEMGAAALTGKIDALVEQAVLSITETQQGQNFLSTDPGFQSFLAEKGITLDPSDSNYAKKAANALVLFAASESENVDLATWMSTLESSGALPGSLSASTVLPLAAEYAMMAAYCSDEDALLTKTTTIAGAVYNLRSKNDADAAELVEGVTLDTMTTPENQARINAWLEEKIASGVYSEGSTAAYYTNAAKTKISGIKVTEPDTVTVSSVNASQWFTDQTADMSEYGIFSITGLHGAIDNTTGQPIDYTGMWETFSQSDEFQSYVQNQAASDLTAFTSALQMVDDNTSNVDIDSVLSQGWTNGGIADLIGAVTGNK